MRHFDSPEADTERQDIVQLCTHTRVSRLDYHLLPVVFIVTLTM